MFNGRRCGLGLKDVGKEKQRKGFLVLDSWTACDGHANSVLAIESAQQLGCRRPLAVTLLTRTAKQSKKLPVLFDRLAASVREMQASPPTCFV